MYFLVYEGLSKYGVGVAKGTVFQKIRPEAGFATGDFVKEKLEGLPWNDSYPPDILVQRNFRAIPTKGAHPPPEEKTDE